MTTVDTGENCHLDRDRRFTGALRSLLFIFDPIAAPVNRGSSLTLRLELNSPSNQCSVKSGGRIVWFRLHFAHKSRRYVIAELTSDFSHWYYCTWIRTGKLIYVQNFSFAKEKWRDNSACISPARMSAWRRTSPTADPQLTSRASRLEEIYEEGKRESNCRHEDFQSRDDTGTMCHHCS